MKNIFHLCLLSLLFSYPLIIKAETESNEAVENTYICLDESMSEISQVVSEISALDSDLDSPVHLLKRHLENGYLLGLRDEVVGVLEYADWFMNQQPITNEKRAVAPKLDRVIEQVSSGDLNMTEEDVMKSPHLFKIDERLLVKGKAIFKNIVVMDKKLRVHGRARFYDHVTFKEDVRFKDDVTIEGNLTVTDLTVLSCLDELCVSDLSIIDGFVSGTLSVNDLVTQNLTVVNCIDDLCVLSMNGPVSFNDAIIQNLTVSGTLSVQEEVVGCDLTVGCNINMNNSTSSAVGNINKIGNRFIHNFGVENTFVGVNSGNFTMTGTDNTGFGFRALTNITTGNFNTAVGSNALLLNTTGAGNTAVGYQALNINTIGNFNTAIGFETLSANLNGIDNTALGWGAGNGLIGGDNNIYIGANVSGLAVESNTIRIGLSAAVATFIQGIFGQSVGGVNAPVLVDNTGQLGTVVSSRKFKQNIEDLKSESGRIFDLTPVKFIFKKDETKTQQYGLIAEDVAEVFPELVINDKEGKPFSVRYEVLPILLLNEMQKQQHEMQIQQYEIQKQQYEIQKQQYEIQNQQREIQQQEQKIKTLDSKVESMSSAFNNLKRQVEKFTRN